MIRKFLGSIVFVLFLSSPGLVFGQTQVLDTFTADVDITVDATPDYAAGDLVGDKLTIAGIAKSGTGSGTVQKILLTNQVSHSIDLTVWIFDSDPTNTTFTDNSGFTIDDNDIEKVICVIPVVIHEASGSGASVSIADNVGCDFDMGGGNTDLYAAVEAEGAINFAATDDFHMRVTGQRD